MRLLFIRRNTILVKHQEFLYFFIIQYLPGCQREIPEQVFHAVTGLGQNIFIIIIQLRFSKAGDKTADREQAGTSHEQKDAEKRNKYSGF